MNTILKINNDYSHVITDQNVRNLLWGKLRFLKMGYFHTRAFQNGQWDGYVSFLDKKTGRFLTGLLPEVRLVLNRWDVPFVTQDYREITPFLYDNIDENFMKPWAIVGEPDTLYDYQVDLVNQAIKYKRGIIQAPTGAGKTLLMLAIMRAIPAKTPILFLANRKTLISQNYDEIKKWGFDNVGRFYSDYHEPNIITCCTVQSAHHLDKLLPKFKAVIADEIHTLGNDTGIKTFKKLTGASIRLAVSATPFKHGGKDEVQKYTIKGYFGPIFKTKLTEDGILRTNYLQNRENLSASICKFYYIDEPSIPYDIYVDAVTNGIANNWHFHKFTADLAKTLNGRTLILVERIAHGDSLNNLIPNSLWVQGKDNEETRKNVINQLQKSKNNVIAIATKQIFGIGVNFRIHNLIDCSDTAAEHGIIQLIGRGLRLAEDKEKLNYYSFIHRTNPYLEKHSLDRIKILRKEGHEVIIKDEIDL